MPTAAAVSSEALTMCLVLVEAGAEDLRAVAAEQEDRGHPADDHHRAGDVERVADVDVGHVVGNGIVSRPRIAANTLNVTSTRSVPKATVGM